MDSSFFEVIGTYTSQFLNGATYLADVECNESTVKANLYLRYTDDSFMSKAVN